MKLDLHFGDGALMLYMESVKDTSFLEQLAERFSWSQFVSCLNVFENFWCVHTLWLMPLPV
jgi:hypothetical protein